MITRRAAAPFMPPLPPTPAPRPRRGGRQARAHPYGTERCGPQTLINTTGLNRPGGAAGRAYTFRPGVTAGRTHQ